MKRDSWEAPAAEGRLARLGALLREDARRLLQEVRAVRFRRPGKAALRWIASLFAVVSVALIVFFALFDWNWMRGPAGRYASAKLHREVRITGDLDVKLFSRTPRITAEGVTVAQPAWAGGGAMARLPRITAEVEFWPLLRGDVRLPLLDVDQPVVDLRRNAAGEANWDFGDPDRDENEPARLPPIRHFIIDGGKLSFDDRQRGLKFNGTISTSERSDADSAEAFRLDGRGTVNTEPFRLEVTGGPLVNVRPDRPYPFRAEVTAGDTRAVARGSIPKPFDLGVFSMALTLEGDDLAEVYALTGLALPNTPPYRLSGRLSRDGSTYRMRGMTGRVGDSDLSGALTVKTARKRPHLSADLTSRSLDFDDLATVLGGAPNPAETASPEQKAAAARLRGARRLLPDAPLYTERLRSMDADVRYRAASVKARLPLREVSVDLQLERGVLSLNPVSFRFPQGRLDGGVRIDGRKAMPVTDIDFRLRGARVEQFLPVRGGSAPLEGVLHARAKLHGQGRSVREAASNASGGVTLVMPNGRMRQAFAELLGINAGKGLLLLLSKDERETPVRCAVADFTVRGGTLTSRRIVIDTGVVLANGSGVIDLDDESLNLVIDGETKQPRLLRVWSPITVQGRLQDPQFGVKGGQVAAQTGIAAALGALITPLAALLPFVDPGLAEDADCGALIAQAGRQGAAVTAATSPLTR